MSYLATKEKECPHCQFPNEIEVWSIVNVREDPELKDLLMGGELNLIECTSCQKIFYAEDFILYHDPDSELLAFVYPYEYKGEKDKYIQKTKDDFAASQSSLGLQGVVPYAPITLFGLDELLAVVEWDDEAKIQSDIVAMIAQERGLAIKKLHTAFSRAEKIPPLLPLKSSGGTTEHEQMLAALRVIKSENDHLTLYAQALDRLSQNTSLKLEFSDSRPA